MTKKILLYVSGIALIAGAAALLSVDNKNEDLPSTTKKAVLPGYQISSVKLPSTLDFAGEQVPLDLSDVKESLDREMLVNSYWQSQTILFLKRSERWFPTIDSILIAEGVPTDFKYLALIESGLDHVVSPAGATGYWQFMKTTAKLYGLEVNGEVDERYNVIKSTKAAAKYLKEGYTKFNSWTLAAASYNMGMNGVSKRLNAQQVDSYYDLLLNRETGRYVYRILAVKLIMSNPERYGFYVKPEEKYVPYKTVTDTIKGSVSSWATYAKNKGTNYKVLKILNPWLRTKSLTNSEKKTYLIQLPANDSKLLGVNE